jgi:hypothetical protein
VPYRHDIYWTFDASWWNFDTTKGKTEKAKKLQAIYTELSRTNADDATGLLEHVQAIAATADERGAAVDRRATTIAGTVAIAASFTLAGAGLALDQERMTHQGLRIAFAIIAFFTTCFFVVSAYFALRALASREARTWNWPDPGGLRRAAKSDAVGRLRHRAAELLWCFAANWEITDFKARTVDKALRALLGALVGLAVLAGLVALTVSLN